MDKQGNHMLAHSHKLLVQTMPNNRLQFTVKQMELLSQQIQQEHFFLCLQGPLRYLTAAVSCLLASEETALETEVFKNLV